MCNRVLKNTEIDIKKEQLKEIIDCLWQEIRYGRLHLLFWRDMNKFLANNREIEAKAPMFFAFMREAHRKCALLSISKVYDKHRDSGNIYLIMELSEAIKSNSSDEKYLEDLLAEWDNQKKDLASTVDGLRKFRNKKLVHNDKKQLLKELELTDDEKLTLGKVAELYDKAGEFVDKASSAFFSSLDMKVEHLVDFENLFEDNDITSKK